MPAMDSRARIHVAGHTGMVGSALLRELRRRGYRHLLVCPRAHLDLADRYRVARFFRDERPDVVVLAAGRVGGIEANRAYPADLIRENLDIQSSVIQEAFAAGVRRLLFFGSNCAYPRDCPQPMREEHLLGGPLEPTSEAYATAKLAGMAMCRAYNLQHGVRYLSVIPATLYGPGGHFDLRSAHVVHALLHRFQLASERNRHEVVVWGSGRPLRELLHVDDLAAACVTLLEAGDPVLDGLLREIGWIVNVGSGEEMSIEDLAGRVRDVVDGDLIVRFDTDRPDGAPRKLLDASRIRSLGWSPRVSLSPGLAGTHEWFCRVWRARQRSGTGLPD